MTFEKALQMAEGFSIGPFVDCYEYEDAFVFRPARSFGPVPVTVMKDTGKMVKGMAEYLIGKKPIQYYDMDPSANKFDPPFEEE